MSITINAAPIENRILLDSNNTVVSVTSSNGSGYYFRAKIYVDGVLFDEQGWSRKDEFTAEKDLVKLCNAYYQTLFNTFVPGLTEQTHLIKRINILISEYALATDVLSQEVYFPEFFLMYNAKASNFTDETKIQFLGVEPEIFLLPIDGKISIPFIFNADDETLNVVLKDNLNNVLDSYEIESLSGKKVYMFQYDLLGAALSNSLYLTVSMTLGSSSISKNIRLMQLPDYPPKEIAFLNNFGYWQYAYLSGELKIDKNLSVETYEQRDNSEKIFEINEESTYTVNTGSYLTSEKEIINQIVNSLESKIFLNSEWLSMVSKTKKISVFKDRNNLYAEGLSFSVRTNSSVANTSLGPVTPAPDFNLLTSFYYFPIYPAPETSALRTLTCFLVGETEGVTVTWEIYKFKVGLDEIPLDTAGILVTIFDVNAVSPQITVSTNQTFNITLKATVTDGVSTLEKTINVDVIYTP